MKIGQVVSRKIHRSDRVHAKAETKARRALRRNDTSSYPMSLQLDVVSFACCRRREQKPERNQHSIAGFQMRVDILQGAVKR